MSVKSRIADEYANSRQSKRERSNDTHRANLELRNKAFDYLMEDGETRKFVIDTARDTYSTGKQVLKVTGIALLIGVSVWGIYKVSSKLMDKYSQNKRVNEYTQGMDKKNLSYKEQDYVTWADKLYRVGFDQNATFYVNYDESLIKNILQSLKTLDDWKYLVQVFASKEVKIGTGKGEYHDLPWYLSQDDDAPKYQEIINKLGANIQL